MALGIVQRLMGATLAGALLMGAEPAPGGPPMPVDPVRGRAAYFAKALPQPTLYQITTTVDGKAGKPAQTCMSAESVMQQGDASHALARAHSTAPPTPGCTHSVRLTPGGGAHTEMACDKAAGASATFRSTSDSDGRLQMRHHMEAQVAGPNGMRTQVSDTTIAAVGPCPADLKPGEMRLPDGRKVKAGARLAPAAGAAK